MKHFALTGDAAVRCTTSRRCTRGLWMPFAILIFLSDLMRIGEALNPGPEIAPTAEDTFVLGTFNPSGLRNKLPYISSQLAYGDVWAISETHFTGQDAQVYMGRRAPIRARHDLGVTLSFTCIQPS